MIRVRFPNGVTVQYNTANYASNLNSTESSCVWLYTKKDGDLVALVQNSAGVILEWCSPCSVYQALGDPNGDRLESILTDIAAIKRKVAKLSTGERRGRR